MNLKKDFGKRLKNLRIKNKITQEKLAEIVGIDEKHVSHIETGRSFPKADLIEKFAIALDIDYKILFNFERDVSREKMLEQISKICNSADDETLFLIHKLILDLTNK